MYYSVLELSHRATSHSFCSGTESTSKVGNKLGAILRAISIGHHHMTCSFRRYLCRTGSSYWDWINHVNVRPDWFGSDNQEHNQSRVQYLKSWRLIYIPGSLIIGSSSRRCRRTTSTGFPHWEAIRPMIGTSTLVPITASPPIVQESGGANICMFLKRANHIPDPWWKFGRAARKGKSQLRSSVYPSSFSSRWLMVDDEDQPMYFNQSASHGRTEVVGRGLPSRTGRTPRLFVYRRSAHYSADKIDLCTCIYIYILNK